MLAIMLFVTILFIILTPGVLLKLPSAKSSPLTTAVVHGIVFAIVYHLVLHTNNGLGPFFKD